MSPEELSARLLKGITALEPAQPQDSLPGDARPAQTPPSLSDEALAVASSLRRVTISPAVITGFVRAIEALLVAGAGAATLSAFATSANLYPLVATAILAGVLLVSLSLQGADCYQIAVMRTRLRQSLRVSIALSLAFGFLVVGETLGSLGVTLPPAWLEYWFASILFIIIPLRLALAELLRHLTAAHRLEHRAVIVGGGETAANLIARIENDPDHATRICGIFDDRENDRSPPIVSGYAKLGSVSDLVEFGRIAHIDMLLVTIPMHAEQRLLQLLKRLWVLPVDIRLVAHTDGLDFRSRTVLPKGPLPFVSVVDKPVADLDAVVKRLVDLAVASIALIVLAPLLVVTALAIRMESSGPILFRQKRYGFKNEVIEVLKFRSMYHHYSDPSAKRVVTKNDPRVTRVGRIIRKTSIDELPQLFNVISGRLSLVGPRPHAINAHTNERLWEQVVDGYFARHKVKPGITGWAQINGWRGEVDTPEKIRKRVAYDIAYIENWSILFDLYILMRTPFALLRTENAY